MEAMIKHPFLIVIIFCWSFLFSCTSSPKEQSHVPTEQKVVSIDFQHAEKLRAEGAVFIDNRPAHKYQKGHIDGAVNLPFFQPGHSSNVMTKENLLKAIGDKSKVVFYCTGYNRAYHALKQAQTWKIDKEMFWYQKGYAEWSQKSR